MVSLEKLREAYRQRLKRRRLLWRALRSRHGLTLRSDRTGNIHKTDILLFICLRNEAPRLPYFLEHYRKLGVNHFLVVDNASSDGSADLLAVQPDVSLWQTARSYKAARFGMDWVNHLLARYGAGHWCLTVDADELLVYPHCDAAPLPVLTGWLDRRGVPMMAATMLDLYPKGPLSEARYSAGQDPTDALPYFDATGYDRTPLPRYQATSIRGGPRKRVFFADQPERAPHLHKTPLIRWHWRYAYLSSTHIALPGNLNRGFDAPDLPTGVLLHTKFLDGIIERSREEKSRGEHFTHSERYHDYYNAIIADPDLWHADAGHYDGPGQLKDAGLMQSGLWSGE
ncbi:glycosyltransferase family 2 protein [Thioclava sp. A2]|uniref:glycosyltransferase family 2 protein n=1 Tax=Thioclava sp. FCG-A2 TaxID=3080562 RepID=UPI002955DB00|nr:glycosyltransferase family 2 protein [Thioclava sp. A2]MDV7270602.1 glycosyltransferase family 2 protein [Thioclava sp. A2]